MSEQAASQPLKIGIFRTSSIGDVVLASACLDLLRNIGVEADITWLGRSPSLSLIKTAYPEVRVVELKKGDVRSQFKTLGEELGDLDFVVDLQTNLGSRLLCRHLKKEKGIPSYRCEKGGLSRARMVAAARIRGRRKPAPTSYIKPPHLQYELMAGTLKAALREHLPQMERAKVLDAECTPSLPNGHEENTRPWQKELKFGSWLAVAPGAAHATKQAPFSVMVNILEGLKAAYRDGQKAVGLIFLGDERDREIALRLLDQIQWPHSTLNLAGRLSLWESALALREARILLTNDSSLAHIAEAVGTPAAVLFGPTVEGFGFAPWRSESRAFSKPLGCRPCSKHGKLACRYQDKLCFQTLPFVEIIDHLKVALDREKN